MAGLSMDYMKSNIVSINIKDMGTYKLRKITTLFVIYVCYKIAPALFWEYTYATIQ